MFFPSPLPVDVPPPPGEVIQFLTSRFESAVSDVSEVGQGEWSHAYMFKVGTTSRVIRFGALSEDFAKDQIAMRWTSPALPIPRVTELGPAFGGYYAISELVTGTFLEQLDASGFRKVLPALFRALDALRNANISESAGYGLWDSSGRGAYGSWHNFILDVEHDRPESRIHGWHDHMRDFPHAEAAFRVGLTKLQSLVHTCPEDRHVIHGDLLHRNVFVRSAAISGVIDWGCSMYGDFLYDVAMFSFWSIWFPALAHVDFPAEALAHYQRMGTSVPNFQQRMQCYQLHIGLSSLAYSILKQRPKNVQFIAHRIMEVAQQ